MHSFKRTLSKALLFILTVVLVSVIITEPYFQNEVYHYQDAAVRDELAGELDTLICGSSHAYYGIVPAVVDEMMGVNSYNLASTLMTGAGRYDLLRKELDRNPVDFVILDISYNTLTRDRGVEGPEGDLYQLGRYRNPLDRMVYFFRNFWLREYGAVYYDTLDRGFTAIGKLWNGEGQRGTSVKYETKGWLPSEHNDLYLPDPAQFHTVELTTQINPASQADMDAIIALCQEREIPVVVVGLPISQRMTTMYGDWDVVYNDLVRYCQERDVPFFDFNLYKGKTMLLNDYDAFFDETHLATEGAYTFTELMCQTLLLWQAGEDVSDYFYPSYAVAEELALCWSDVPLDME